MSVGLDQFYFTLTLTLTLTLTCNCELLTSVNRDGVVLQADGQTGLDGTSSCDQSVGLEHSLDAAKGIMEGTVHFVEHVLVSSAQHDGGGTALAVADVEELAVSDALLLDGSGSSEVGSVELRRSTKQESKSELVS